MSSCGLDTIHLKSHFHPAYLDHIEGKRITEHQNGIITETGWIDNLFIKISPSGTRIEGSFARFQNGSNKLLLEPESFGSCLEKLSNRIGIDLSLAIVTRIDFAFDMAMKEAPGQYFHFFGEHSKMKRITCVKDESLYYKFESTPELIRIYDKDKEVKAKGRNIGKPVVEVGKNLMRIEYQQDQPSRTLKRELEGAKLTAKLLTDRGVFDLIQVKAKTRINQIAIETPAILSSAEAKTPTELREFHAANDIKRPGSMRQILDGIKDRTKRHIITQAQGKALRREARRLYGLESNTGQSNELEELAQKLNSLYNN